MAGGTGREPTESRDANEMRGGFGEEVIRSNVALYQPLFEALTCVNAHLQPLKWLSSFYRF